MFGLKCPLCKERYKKEESAILRYTASGHTHEMGICLSCADALDKIADASIEKRTSKDGDEPV